MTTTGSVFVSHGAPTVALEDSPYTRALGAWAAGPRASVAIVMSAHWRSRGFDVSGDEAPETIHDFGGFGPELQALNYPAPGAPSVAATLAAALAGTAHGSTVVSRGLDHGTWVPMRLMWPAADLPVVQVAIPRRATPRDLAMAGGIVAAAAPAGAVIMGSGGVVHNLGELDWDGPEAATMPWAAEFDRWITTRVLAGDLEALLEWERSAPQPRRAHPTWEHLAPLFFAMGAGRGQARSLYEGFTYGSLAMRCYCWPGKSEGG